MIWRTEFKEMWPPSVNRIWRRVGNRTLISKDGRKFFDAMAAAIEMDQARGNLPSTPITGDVEIELRFTPPTRARRDVDNLLKGIFDAFTKGHVWCDDSQVCKVTAELVRDKIPGGLIEVWIHDQC